LFETIDYDQVLVTLLMHAYCVQMF